MREDPTLQDLPIVALTAHALNDERTQCLEAGMNAFVSKPFKPHELFAAVEGWGAMGAALAASQDDEPAAEAPVSDDGTPPVDLASFRATMAEVGLEDRVATTLGVFAGDAPGRIGALQDAIGRGNGAQVAATAHSLKSAAATIGAHTLAALLKEIEIAGRNSAFEEATQLAAAIEREGQAVIAYLEKQGIMAQEMAG
ncbi:MAG: Hpt domain-containing protein [Gemmatimonadetes bacterium]|nr:Hpt domain-containing protein [Gemmatimonadota bacterium]